MKKMVGVIGAVQCNPEVYDMARSVGAGIAEAGWMLVCGGLGGVMEGACRGACEAGGQTVGILPGPDSNNANPYVTIPIVTNMGHARNIVIAHTAHILVAIAGGYGTLSEISIALKLGKPVIGLQSWQIIEGIHPVTTPEAALDAISSLAQGAI